MVWIKCPLSMWFWSEVQKCCRKADVDPAELALAEEEAAERKAAVAAMKAEREAQLEAMRQEAPNVRLNLRLRLQRKHQKLQILLVRHLSLQKSICRGMRFRKGCMGMLMKTLQIPEQAESDPEPTTDDV